MAVHNLKERKIIVHIDGLNHEQNKFILKLQTDNIKNPLYPIFIKKYLGNSNLSEKEVAARLNALKHMHERNEKALELLVCLDNLQSVAPIGMKKAFQLMV